MKKYNVLILTDHTNHSKENSVYALALALRNHAMTNQVDIASRGFSENTDFFNKLQPGNILATTITENFRFSENGRLLRQGLKDVRLSEYDLVWLRLPPPLHSSFLSFMDTEFPEQFVINAPSAIYETGSKAFLMQFQSVCAPMKICRSLEDIIEFKKQFPIVLKPFRGYGGKGIVRIDGDIVWIGDKQITFKEFAATFKEKKEDYLGVKFLKNVSKGDKRIIVVKDKIMGASLRLPAKDSWLCNVALGGSSHLSEIEEEEYKIVEAVNPTLSKMGIVMYGLDTLVDDNGKRVLSEINTTSIGGLPQMAQQKKLPLVEEAIDLIWEYFLKNRNNAE